MATSSAAFLLLSIRLSGLLSPSGDRPPASTPNGPSMVVPSISPRSSTAGYRWMDTEYPQDSGAIIDLRLPISQSQHETQNPVSTETANTEQKDPRAIVAQVGSLVVLHRIATGPRFSFLAQPHTQDAASFLGNTPKPSKGHLPASHRCSST
ncbi:hypothetical protein CC79DRAFT_1329753 [Sarocladium strictum]